MFRRHPRFPLYFSAACLVGGCLLFAGALHVHQDLYTYSIHKEVEERRQHPSEVGYVSSCKLDHRQSFTGRSMAWQQPFSSSRLPALLSILRT